MLSSEIVSHLSSEGGKGQLQKGGPLAGGTEEEVLWGGVGKG